MKVLQVHNFYRDRGGEDIVVEAEASALRAAGHTVTALFADNPMSSSASLRQLAVAPWNRRAARRVAQAIARERPDVAHVHNTWYSLSPSVVAALHRGGIPVVMTLHNYRLMCIDATLRRDGGPCTDCVGTHPWRGVQHRCYRDSLGASAAAAATLAVSRRARVWTEAVSAYIAPTESVRDIVVSSGVAGNRPVWVKPHAVSDVAARPAPPSQSRKVLFVGRLVETKGVDVLLDAWSLAEPELELVVVGDGPLRAAMEASPRPGVSFTGYLPNPAVRDLMRESRALAFPAVSEEVFGCAVVEAMSAGLPVLATDRGGPARLTRPVGEEWLVAVGDVQAWANALRRLEDPGIVDTGGAAARQEYERRYRPEASANALVEIYESVQRPAAMRQGL